jgi:protein tyrosine phosphatase (PTP) superfamily phosphohydrolase (DUF442 family)
MSSMSRLLILFVLTALCAPGCFEPAAPTAAQTAATGKPEKVSAEHLPNPYRVHPKIISGGLPEGEAAFAELARLGIKTIISVDGARPDVEAARRNGMRYVHLPHGYDGIADDRAKELAKAVRDLEGPIYIHCHHGKHRSPAAAAVACVAAGLIEQTAALAVLTTAGTSPNYRGLYESAKMVRRLDDAVLDNLRVEFPETAKIPPMAEAMVALERTFDQMNAIAKAQWASPARHPDLDPAHEALLLREHFTEMLRTDEVRGQPMRFRQLLEESESAAAELESSLRAWQTAGRKPPVPHGIAKAFDRVAQRCATCHQEFRDVPLGEKAGVLPQ